MSRINRLLQRLSHSSQTQRAPPPRDIYSTLPLNESAFEIRLVTLHPGHPGHPIICSLRTASLRSGVTYDALSYVWGDPESTETINVNQCRLDITSNLHTALDSLRLLETPLILWIDALCINQNDNNERNHQVRGMTSIYRNAQRVFIWLGFLRDVSRAALLERIRRRHESTNNDPYPTWEGSQALTLANNEAGTLVNLVLRDWFHRIWTKQELAVALKDPWVVFGSRWLRWSSFCNAVRDAPRESWNEEEFAQLLGYDEIRTRYNNRSMGMSLYFLLYHTRNANASDPRDKVYALLGLSSAPTLAVFQPDYSLSVEEVCRITTTHLLRAEKSLRPLLRWSKRNDLLPSWVPDFTSTDPEMSAPAPLIEPTDSELYSTSAQTTRSINTSEDMNCLFLRGLQVDTIESTNPRWWKVDDSQRREEVSRNIAGMDIRQHLDKSEPLWRTLIVNKDVQYGMKVDPPEDYSGTHIDWWHYLSRRYPNDKTTVRLANRCAAVMHRRTVFTTRAGLRGIGPRSAREGDVVTVLYGGEVPFILRGHGTHYEYIGECYVAGIMKGEFIQLYEQYKGEPGCPEEQEFTLR